MLEVKDIYFSYGSMPVLRGVSLEVKRGSVTALIGPNGAGKTTLMLNIAGWYKPSYGEIMFEGRKINGLPPHHIAKLGIVLVPEGRKLYPNMTVLENLLAVSHFYSSKAEFLENLNKIWKIFPVLKERQKQLARTLSGGEQQMLAIARALMSKPRLLLLDEPSIGLMPILVSKLFKIIKELNNEGLTILITEQNVIQTLKIAHYVYILENGVIAHEGRPDELLNNEKIRKIYLGI